MNLFYKVIDTVKDIVENYDFNNTVTFGELSDVDIDKMTAFPLLHIKLESVTNEGKTLRYKLVIIAADVLDVSKDRTDDLYYRNSNMQDIFNTQLVVITNVIEKLRRLDLVDTNFLRIDSDIVSTAFTERFNNVLVGWECDLEILSFNNLGICE